jgi:hypothetical protein
VRVYDLAEVHGLLKKGGDRHRPETRVLRKKQAIQFLQALAEGGQRVEVRSARAGAASAGISRTHLNMAKEELGLDHLFDAATRRWYWQKVNGTALERATRLFLAATSKEPCSVVDFRRRCKEVGVSVVTEKQAARALGIVQRRFVQRGPVFYCRPGQELLKEARGNGRPAQAAAVPAEAVAQREATSSPPPATRRRGRPKDLGLHDRHKKIAEAYLSRQAGESGADVARKLRISESTVDKAVKWYRDQRRK